MKATTACLVALLRGPTLTHAFVSRSRMRSSAVKMSRDPKEETTTTIHPPIIMENNNRTTTLPLAPRDRFPWLYAVVEEIPRHHVVAVDDGTTQTPQELPDSASSFPITTIMGNAVTTSNNNNNLSTLAIHVLATVACVSLLNQGLSQWEWFQTWRYAWPLGLGGLFFYQGVTQGLGYNTQTESSLVFPGEPKESSSSFTRGWWYPWSIAAAGAALMVGGAADAWLPVYVTGPNLFTAAGLGPDAAAYLLAVTLWQQTVSFTTRRTKHDDTVSSLGNVFLVAQLYILGAGSLDDVVSQTTAVVVSNAM